MFALSHMVLRRSANRASYGSVFACDTPLLQHLVPLSGSVRFSSFRMSVNCKKIEGLWYCFNAASFTRPLNILHFTYVADTSMQCSVRLEEKQAQTTPTATGVKGPANGLVKSLYWSWDLNWRPSNQKRSVQIRCVINVCICPIYECILYIKLTIIRSELGWFL